MYANWKRSYKGDYKMREFFDFVIPFILGIMTGWITMMYMQLEQDPIEDDEDDDRTESGLVSDEVM